MSRHMAALKEVGLVMDRRDAQWVRYRFNRNADASVVRIVTAVLDEAEDRVATPPERSAA